MNLNLEGFCGILLETGIMNGDWADIMNSNDSKLLTRFQINNIHLRSKETKFQEVKSVNKTVLSSYCYSWTTQDLLRQSVEMSSSVNYDHSLLLINLSSIFSEHSISPCSWTHMTYTVNCFTYFEYIILYFYFTIEERLYFETQWNVNWNLLTIRLR